VAGVQKVVEGVAPAMLAALRSKAAPSMMPQKLCVIVFIVMCLRG
jgi:hypothetical protein